MAKGKASQLHVTPRSDRSARLDRPTQANPSRLCLSRNEYAEEDDPGVHLEPIVTPRIDGQEVASSLARIEFSGAAHWHEVRIGKPGRAWDDQENMPVGIERPGRAVRAEAGRPVQDNLAIGRDRWAGEKAWVAQRVVAVGGRYRPVRSLKRVRNDVEVLTRLDATRGDRPRGAHEHS